MAIHLSDKILKRGHYNEKSNFDVYMQFFLPKHERHQFCRVGRKDSNGTTS